MSLTLAVLSINSQAFEPANCDIPESWFTFNAATQPYTKTIVTGVNQLYQGYPLCKGAVDPTGIEISDKKSTSANIAFMVPCGTGSDQLLVTFYEEDVRTNRVYSSTKEKVICYEEDDRIWPNAIGREKASTQQSASRILNVAAQPFAPSSWFGALGAMTTLGVAIFVLIWIILWIIVPFIIFAMNSKLKQLDRRLERIIQLLEEKH